MATGKDTMVQSFRLQISRLQVELDKNADVLVEVAQQRERLEAKRDALAAEVKGYKDLLVSLGEDPDAPPEEINRDDVA